MELLYFAGSKRQIEDQPNSLLRMVGGMTLPKSSYGGFAIVDSKPGVARGGLKRVYNLLTCLMHDANAGFLLVGE